MFKIKRFPEALTSFFDSLEENFQWEHHTQFTRLTILFAFAWGSRNITNLYSHAELERHRSRYNNFINIERWNPEAVLKQKAEEMLESLNLTEEDEINFLLDDSFKLKYGDSMQAANWFHDHVLGTTLFGYKFVVAVIEVRGFVIPFGLKLYVKEEEIQEDDDLEIEFKKKTELAAELISLFEAPEEPKVTVLFDSFYLCRKVLKAVREQGWVFVSRLKSNRNLYKNGEKLKAGEYGKNLYGRKKKKTLITEKGQRKSGYRFVDAGWLDVSKVGRARVIFSRKNSKKDVVGLVTNDPELTGKQIIETYEIRWNIEVFFKDAKQLLGLGQCQNLGYEAAVRHLHMACSAYALLTHLRMIRSGEKGEQKKAGEASMRRMQNELRRIVWDDLVDYLEDFESGTEVLEELDNLLMAA